MTCCITQSGGVCPYDKAVGKLVRELSVAAQKASARFKVELGLLNNSCLIAIVWMSISKSRGKLVGESVLNIFVIAVAGVALHFVFLAVNWTMTTPILGLPEKERRAVLLMTSQAGSPKRNSVALRRTSPTAARSSRCRLSCASRRIAEGVRLKTNKYFTYVGIECGK